MAIPASMSVTELVLGNSDLLGCILRHCVTGLELQDLDTLPSNLPAVCRRWRQVHVEHCRACYLSRRDLFRRKYKLRMLANSSLSKDDSWQRSCDLRRLIDGSVHVTDPRTAVLHMLDEGVSPREANWLDSYVLSCSAVVDVVLVSRLRS
jgi:hypothetical protein